MPPEKARQAGVLPGSVQDCWGRVWKTKGQRQYADERRRSDEKPQWEMSFVEINGAYLPVSDGVCRD